ncbi:endolytic transglycosylase MltG [Flavobacterium sp.]|uniref:endolytic transglycosylase MltG n=1 Tax=Flavobacterium sp. TaxID=239 RepID=UPI002B4AB396|nr:endolytic transglycosylase MltG [Flavobacterium sp.]HLP65859.1 endolytic transglycosylase MltG [Flavobacterium sp.]
MSSKLKKIIGISAILFLVVAVFGYMKLIKSNTAFEENEVYVYIPSNATYDDAKKIIAPYVENIGAFEWFNGLRGYDKKVKPGKFLLKKGMGNFKLVSALRRNVPVTISYNNQERLENLVQRIAKKIEADSTQLMQSFTNDDFLTKNGFTKENVFTLFLPNTYEFYWNTSADEFRDKMLKEYKKFWTEERLKKAENLNMTPMQVTTLASIVHKETVKADERPRVAKVYLNRLDLGMPLQADPTIIYSKKLMTNDFDQVIKRVYYGDFNIDSPYNTYMYQGLPPGPIAMPDINAIDAVLNPEDHDYIYFCASVERFGYHEFASTLSQHNVNAAKYAQWLNEQGTK